MSARKNGLTGRTMYEYDQNNILFSLVNKTGTAEILVNKKQASLEDFFNKQNIFPGAPENVLEDAAKKLLDEIAVSEKKCKSHGDGYTERLWSSEGEKIQNQPGKIPASAN